VGDYHRLLVPGSYTLTFSAPGYQSKQFSGVVVADGDATRLDVQLVPLQPAAVTGTVTASGGGALLARVEAYYHLNGELADSTTTDPADGSYSLSVMETDYDIKAYASGYAPQWEYVNVVGDTMIDFVLDPISGSILVVDDDGGSRLLSKGPSQFHRRMRGVAHFAPYRCRSQARQVPVHRRVRRPQPRQGSDPRKAPHLHWRMQVTTAPVRQRCTTRKPEA
jgi:hypothetical protein